MQENCILFILFVNLAKLEEVIAENLSKFKLRYT